MPFRENLDVFFRVWGEVVLVGAPGVEQQMTAIFDNDYQAVVESEYTEVSSSQPALTAKSADVATLGISSRSLIRVRGVLYQVNDLQPDGTGITILYLWKKD